MGALRDSYIYLGKSFELKFLITVIVIKFDNRQDDTRPAGLVYHQCDAFSTFKNE